MSPTPANDLLRRAPSQPASGSATGGSSSDEFLHLIASPFDSQFQSQSFLSAVIFSLALTGAIGLAFCFIRPYNNVVYAPRAKHADSKHAPPPIEKGLFGWVKVLIRTKEPELVQEVGLDAAVFLRFGRMMRMMFLVLTVVGCGILIPLNLIENKDAKASFLTKLTPIYFSESTACWAFVVVAYLFDLVIFFFLWRTYGAILRLRREYFDTPDYQKSLHSRTLLLTDISEQLRSDDGIVRVTEGIKNSTDTPRAAIARNVKDLPELIEEHEEAVKELEKVLAKYLKNPEKLPANRPTTKVGANDKSYKKGQKVDAIEYLTNRIKELEAEIKEVRLTIDKRNALSYGFATYESIATAHNAAYETRKGGPEGTIIKLAPKPRDLIWKNLAMMKKERSWQNFINNLWVALLTVAWVAPNVMIAVFLSNLTHLGLVWPAFNNQLNENHTLWAIVQGIVAPALTTLFYYFLPAIFRRLVTKAGDVTRTQRERHVMHKLFSFFVFNNLIVFSLFSAIWGYVATLISQSQDSSFSEAIKDSHPFQAIIATMITVTPYWCTWLLQRNLGAAIDLSQLARLVWGSFKRRFMSPTPRELIELTAPQPFEYAAYYNYLLFYTAVTLCFGTLQPLILAITALYFWLDSFGKKYMIMYIFITKYESGGMFWRTLFNRVLVAALLGNIVTALLVGTKGSTWIMPVCLAPLPFLIAGFKWYCMRTFDDGIHYYSQGKALRDEELMSGDKKARKGDRVGTRFGHPALYKPLMTPMVSSKSQHMLKQVYSGRTSFDDTATRAGYSDVYMDAMDANQPGKSSGAAAPFEIVNENQMDYAHWKDNSEFRDAAGELFGPPSDMIRPGTPGSMMTGVTRTETFNSVKTHSRGASQSRDRSDSDSTRVADETPGTEYPRGYHHTPSALRDQSPAGSDFSARYGLQREQSRDGLVGSAARMGRSPPPRSQDPYAPTPGAFSSTRNTPGTTPGSEGGGYDYFRQPRN